MSMHEFRKRLRAGSAALGALACLATLSSCGLDKVTEAPLGGPSTFGLSLVLTITPDVLPADAVSTASVVATLRGPDGKPVGGRQIFFAVTDSSFNLIDLGTLQSSQATFGQLPTAQVTETTNGNGIAQVIYRAPERISLTNITTLHITARIVGNDALGQVYHSVDLELRPTEIQRFPGGTSCGIHVDPPIGPDGGAYPTNFTIRFNSTVSAVQYFWDFGDGHQDTGHPDVQHAWSLDGNYTVTLVVTDTTGVQSQCTAAITIN